MPPLPLFFELMNRCLMTRSDWMTAQPPSTVIVVADAETLICGRGSVKVTAPSQQAGAQPDDLGGESPFTRPQVLA